VEQAAHARRMHFQADVVARWVLAGGKAQRLAVAETDLQHLRRVAAEHRVVIARLAAVVQAEARPGIVERALLGRGEAALAQHETADLATPLTRGIGLGRRLGAFAGERVGHRQPISPSTGEEALAWRLRGMRPAPNASRPASTALRMALAISTGSRAPAIAVFISTPSQPSSMAMASSEAVPTPASTMIGTFAFSMISSRV